MTKLKFNPGHSQEFERLGIFEQFQKEIEDKDLIDIAIERGKIPEVFFLLSQQLRNDTMKLHLVGFELDELVEKSRQITDKQSLTEVEQGLNKALDLLFGITTQSVGSAYCCNEIKERVKDFSEKAKENKRVLDEDFVTFSKAITSREDEFIEKVSLISSRLKTS